MSLIASTVSVADVSYGHMGDWSVLGWLAMVAFWAVVIVGIVWLVREVGGSRRESSPSAGEILEGRLASGEIGVEEYRERSAALADPPHGTSSSGSN